jgi:hypothetical protein
MALPASASGACLRAEVAGGPLASDVDRAVTAETGTRIFFAWNNEITVVDVEPPSSDRIEVPELAAGDPPFFLVSREDHLVFWGGETYALDARNPRGNPVVIADGFGVTRRLLAHSVFIRTSPQSVTSMRKSSGW